MLVDAAAASDAVAALASDSTLRTAYDFQGSYWSLYATLGLYVMSFPGARPRANRPPRRAGPESRRDSPAAAAGSPPRRRRDGPATPPRWLRDGPATPPRRRRDAAAQVVQMGPLPRKRQDVPAARLQAQAPFSDERL